MHVCMYVYIYNILIQCFNSYVTVITSTLKASSEKTTKNSGHSSMGGGAAWKVRDGASWDPMGAG